MYESYTGKTQAGVAEQFTDEKKKTCVAIHVGFIRMIIQTLSFVLLKFNL